MRAPTHVLGGILVGTLLATNAISDGDQLTAMGIIAISVVGSLVPDLDSDTSRLGRYNPLAKYIKHRGFFHSLMFMIVVGIVCVYLFHIEKEILIIFEAGIASHLLLDMLNLYGVQLFYPSTKYIALPIHGIKTGSKGETVVFALLAITIFCQLYFKIITIDLLGTISTWAG